MVFQGYLVGWEHLQGLLGSVGQNQEVDAADAGERDIGCGEGKDGGELDAECGEEDAGDGGVECL